MPLFLVKLYKLIKIIIVKLVVEAIIVLTANLVIPPLIESTGLMFMLKEDFVIVLMDIMRMALKNAKNVKLNG